MTIFPNLRLPSHTPFNRPINNMADAESCIYSASSKQEAFAATLDAIEQCMRQLKVVTDDARKRQLNQKCRDLLGKAEHIKAAETWLQCGRENSGCSMTHSSFNTAIMLTEPLPKRTLSTREQIILLKGSKLYGSLFPPWTSPPSSIEFELPTGESPYLASALSFTAGNIQWMAATRKHIPSIDSSTR